MSYYITTKCERLARHERRQRSETLCLVPNTPNLFHGLIDSKKQGTLVQMNCPSEKLKPFV